MCFSVFLDAFIPNLRVWYPVSPYMFTYHKLGVRYILVTIFTSAFIRQAFEGPPLAGDNHPFLRVVKN